MRSLGQSLRRPIRTFDEGAAPAIGTILLVVITVAMISVIGLYLFTLVQIPEDPPEVKVNFSKLNNRWSASITQSRNPVPLHELRLMVKTEGGDFVTYDSDGDGVADSVMVHELDSLKVATGDGPQVTPIVFVDADGDDQITVGDSLVVYELFIFPVGPLMDADRGHKLVGPNPDGIPRNSTLKVLASHVTLGSTDIHPGDGIKVEIKRGATVVDTVTGNASTSGTFMKDVEVGANWSLGNYDAIFTIRPGEFDEWSSTYTFHVNMESPLTPTEIEEYHAINHPFDAGDIVSLVHVPSNSIVLEFRL